MKKKVYCNMVAVDRFILAKILIINTVINETIIRLGGQTTMKNLPHMTASSPFKKNIQTKRHPPRRTNPYENSHALRPQTSVVTSQVSHLISHIYFPMKRTFLILLNILLSASVFAQSDFTTSVLFPANYQVGDYIEFLSVSPIDARASGT